MMSSEAYKLAEAVLSGKVLVLPKPAAVDDGYVRVELKHCECCPKIFTREVGSKECYCSRCRGRVPRVAEATPRPRERGSYGREHWRMAFSGGAKRPRRQFAKG